MPRKYLLDTNAAIALLNGDAVLASKLSGESDIYLPIPAAGELYFGAQKSSRVAANIAQVSSFINANTLVNCDHVTATSYGQAKAELEAKGRRIPDNDMWIAALTRQHAITLVRRDHHFQHVADITTLSW
jgi:tRNA(fMet)-specific endonuclease VapC